MLRLFRYRDNLFDAYQRKSLEIKNKDKSYKKPSRTIPSNSKGYEIVLRNDIRRLTAKIERLNARRLTNPILINMLNKLTDYGCSPSMAVKYVNDVDTIIERYLRTENDDEPCFEKVRIIISKKTPILLSIVYREIKDYFEFKSISKKRQLI